jgi:hypothetical protein
MRIIDEGQFIKLLPDDGMILTDVATETMRAEEIDLGKSDSSDNYKDIPKDTPIPEPPSDVEQKAAAFDYLTGRSGDSDE